MGLEADEAAGFADAGAGETVLSAPEGTVPSRLASKNFWQPEGRVRNSERLLRIVQGHQALCGMCQARALTNLPVGM